MWGCAVWAVSAALLQDAHDTAWLILLQPLCSSMVHMQHYSGVAKQRPAEAAHLYHGALVRRYACLLCLQTTT